MEPGAGYVFHSRDSWVTQVHEIDLSQELVDKIKVACKLRVGEVAEIMSTTFPFLDRLWLLGEEIDRIVGIKKPKVTDQDSIRSYNETAFKGSGKSDEDRKRLVEDWIERWDVLKEGILAPIQERRYLVHNSFTKIILETAYLACDFEATQRPFEIHIDSASYPAYIENIKRRNDGKVYGVIHAGRQGKLESELNSIIEDSIRTLKVMLNNPNREIESIHENIWNGKRRILGVRSQLLELISTCDRRPTTKISDEFKRKIGF